MTRKQFLNSAAAAVGAAGGLSSPAGGAAKSKMRRGVSLYSYAGDFLVTMTLEDCLADVASLGAEGLEILSEAHVANYPRPSDGWIEQWHGLLAKYRLQPVCYSCWVDSRLIRDRSLSAQEALDMLLRDMRLASRLGFRIMRPKLGTVTADLMPFPEWREMVERALPHAENLKVKIAPEIHAPTLLKSRLVDAYLDLITKTKTRHFGILIDTGIFQNRPRAGAGPGQGSAVPAVNPKDMLALMPYLFHVHDKFWEVGEDLTEPHIPVPEVMSVLIQGGYEGYLCSEYEGPREQWRASDQLRRHHVQLKRLLGEA